MIQGVVDRKEGVRGGEVETGRGGGREGKENGMGRQGGGAMGRDKGSKGGWGGIRGGKGRQGPGAWRGGSEDG